MSWLGLADDRERRFSLRGIGDDRAEERLHPASDDYLLARGTVLFETRMTPDRRPHPLIGFDHSWPNQRTLSFQAIPGGGISFVQVDGERIAHEAIQHAVSTRTILLRITFSWDAPNNWACLTVERPETHEVSSKPVHNVSPMPLRNLRDMIMGHGNCSFDKDVVFMAVSDRVEPVGPTPSLAHQAMVETPFGFKQARDLKRGDTVRARNGDIVPILHRIDRTLPARGSFEPVRLRAPYFGLLDDVLVSPQQRLVIDGSEVEYLFGQEAVLVPARHLVNGFAARKEPPRPTVRYTQFILPKHEAMMVAGTALESLYIGRMRRKPDILQATLLKGIDRGTLPDHARPAFQELKWYDAIHLARQRVA